MSIKTWRFALIVLLVVASAAVLLFAWNPLRASPGRQDGVDLEQYAALQAQVEVLRGQGRDVSRLDQVMADIDYWIAEGKVAEANLRIADLASDLANFESQVYPTYPPAAALPPVPVYVPAPQAGDQVLFEEDFSGPGALAAWTDHFLQYEPGNMAAWQQQQGALCLFMGAGGLQWLGMVNVVGQDWDDYAYSVDMLSGGSQEMGAVFRYQDGQFYRFRFLSEENTTVPTRLLERVEGDQVTVLAQAQGQGYEFKRWYNVQIVVMGADIIVYLDGEDILRATDGRLAQGKVGVYGSSSGDAYFDNVRVTSTR